MNDARKEGVETDVEEWEQFREEFGGNG